MDFKKPNPKRWWFWFLETESVYGAPDLPFSASRLQVPVWPQSDPKLPILKAVSLQCKTVLCRNTVNGRWGLLDTLRMETDC